MVTAFFPLMRLRCALWVYVRFPHERWGHGECGASRPSAACVLADLEVRD